MKNENIETFMSKITFNGSKVCKYQDKETGLSYSLSVASLYPRCDKLELTKDEYKNAVFKGQVKSGDYKYQTVERTTDKFQITKKKDDMGIWVKTKVKAYVLWNVSNSNGIIQTFEDKDKAMALFNEIYDKVSKEDS